MTTVEQWLESIDLGQYKTIFVENDIDLDILPDLTESDLEKLGLSLGHRKRAMRAIADLAASGQAPTQAAMPPAEESEAERRHLTVMFCQLLEDETALQADPGQGAVLTARFQEACRRSITRYDGFPAQYMDDGVMAYFGYPRAHEDDAERAVRAGLEILEAVLAMARDGLPIKGRIGLATGIAVVGDLIVADDGHEFRAVTGQTPNFAARMQAVAPPGTLVIPETVRNALGELFDYQDAGTHELKGFAEPVHVFKVAGERRNISRFEAIHGVNSASLIGREREYAQLMECWREARDGRGQVVLVTAEAGIGKSRLCETMHKSVADEVHFHIRLQCSAHHQDSALYPIISHLEQAAEFRRDDPPDRRLDKLESLLDRSDSRHLAPLLAALLSIPAGGRYPPLRMTPQQLKAKTMEALVELIVGLTDERPVFYHIEDAHWIDPSTEESVAALVDAVAEAPVLLLVTCRPDYAPGWVDRPNVTPLTLGRLDRDDVEKIIAAASGGKRLPDIVIDQIVAKTDGVPLFAEELTKTVLQSGIMIDNGDSFVLDGPLPALAVPSTLQDSLMARLDRMSTVKEILQLGAVIGRTFRHDLLAHSYGKDSAVLDDALEKLIEAEILTRRGHDNEAVFSFRHALLQDAAYESLLRSRRKNLHGRILKAFEDHFPESRDNEPEILAHHASLSGAVEKGVGYRLKAGQRALSRSANIEAANQLKAGIDLLPMLPEGEARIKLELGLQLALGQASIAVYGHAGAETARCFARASALVEAVGDPKQTHEVLFGVMIGYFVAGRLDLALPVAGRLYELAEEMGHPTYLCLGNRFVGNVAFLMGDIATGNRHLSRAVEIYDPARDRALAAAYGADIGLCAKVYLAHTEALSGRPGRGTRMLEECLESSRALGHAMTLGLILSGAAQIFVTTRDLDRVAEAAGEGVEYCQRNNLLYFAAFCRVFSVWAEGMTGNPAEAIEEMRQAIAIYVGTNSRLYLGTQLGMLARLLLAAGRPAEAASTIEEAMREAKLSTEIWCLPEMLRVKALCLAKDQAAEPRAIEDCLNKALGEARRMGARLFEMRAAVALARHLVENRRTDEAKALLEATLARTNDAEDWPDRQEAREIIKSLAA